MGEAPVLVLGVKNTSTVFEMGLLLKWFGLTLFKAHSAWGAREGSGTDRSWSRLCGSLADQKTSP
jgi:hypothetical protein